MLLIKIKKILTICFVVGIASSCPVRVWAANSKLPGTTLEEFAQNDILFYDPSECDPNSRSGTAGILSGNTVAEKIWNYFVRANIDGVSDNAAAIAGIIGNLYTESGLNPFMHGSTGEYYRGLYMLNGDDGGYTIRDAVNSAVGSDYWSFSNFGWWCSINDYPDGSACTDSVLAENNIPESAIDTALKIELDFLVLGEINGEKVSQQTFHNEFVSFVDNFDVITDKDSPRSYAELFLVLVEIAYETSSVAGDALQDSGVSNFAIQHSGYARWQGATSRGDSAERIYDLYASMGSPVNTNYADSMTSDGSNITAASTGGYTKYEDLTDAQILDLAEVAYNESGANVDNFKKYLSIMANAYEKGNDTQTGTGLVDYVSKSEKDLFSKTGYINNSKDVNIKQPSNYIDAARDVLVSGNRVLPRQILFFDAVEDIVEAKSVSNGADVKSDQESWKNGEIEIKNKNNKTYIFYDWLGDGNKVLSGYLADDPPVEDGGDIEDNGDANACPDDSDSGSGALGIAKAAVEMSWPVQDGQGDDSHAGQCEESEGQWVDYVKAVTCNSNPRPLYKEQLIEQGRRADGKDCGVFVGTVLQYVGALENVVSTYDMAGDYFEPSDMWEQVENNGIESMQPGDVLVATGSMLGHSTGHIFIFVGDYGGSYGNIAEASLDDRVGQIGNIYNETVWNIWRYKGGGGESDQAVGPVHDSSVDVPCDSRTIDLGVRDDAYYNGYQYSIRLCSIPNIPDRDGSQDGHNDGYIHVNSRVSGAFYAMAEEHKKRCGSELVASEGFRTAAEQQYFWNLYQSGAGNLAAAPGYSNHQGGLAIDFDTSTYCSNDSSVVSGGWFNASFLSQYGLQDGRSFDENWHIEAME